MNKEIEELAKFKGYTDADIEAEVITFTALKKLQKEGGEGDAWKDL